MPDEIYGVVTRAMTNPQFAYLIGKRRGVTVQDVVSRLPEEWKREVTSKVIHKKAEEAAIAPFSIIHENP